MITVFVVGLAGLISLVPRDESFEGDPAGSVALILAFGAFDIVGALIIWRRPGNALGWIMAAVGVLAPARTSVSVESRSGIEGF